MLLSEIQQKFVFKTRIELDKNNFIELREPKQFEIINMSDDGTKNLEVLAKIFPDCVVDSSFTKEDGTKATGKEIYDELKNSGSLFTEIITTWLQSIPFQQRLMKGGKSDK